MRARKIEFVPPDGTRLIANPCVPLTLPVPNTAAPERLAVIAPDTLAVKEPLTPDDELGLVASWLLLQAPTTAAMSRAATARREFVYVILPLSGSELLRVMAFI
jgi:hypothetical protein